MNLTIVSGAPKVGKTTVANALNVFLPDSSAVFEVFSLEEATAAYKKHIGKGKDFTLILVANNHEHLKAVLIGHRGPTQYIKIHTEEPV